SNALPLFRFNNTYQALVSTVAAAAGVDATATTPTPTTTAVTPAATNRGNNPRRRDGGAIVGELPRADMILL
ncbi:hypothetical protein, partial [Micromonospora phaseoli]|uniref:hypothetical protein n=1 Tax=Micromonospora phaseoli TaxID=1144548 RepID=UPI0019528D4D